MLLEIAFDSARARLARFAAGRAGAIHFWPPARQRAKIIAIRCSCSPTSKWGRSTPRRHGAHGEMQRDSRQTAQRPFETPTIGAERSLIIHFLILASKFWSSPFRRLAWALSFGFLGCLIANMGLALAVNRWSKSFFRCLAASRRRSAQMEHRRHHDARGRHGDRRSDAYPGADAASTSMAPMAHRRRHWPLARTSAVLSAQRIEPDRQSGGANRR